MKRMMALLLGCLLCLCAAGAMAEEKELKIGENGIQYDIYPNGYTETSISNGTTKFISHEGPYVISGQAPNSVVSLGFHAKAYDSGSSQVTGLSVSYDVTFKDLLLGASEYNPAIQFFADEDAKNCRITLNLMSIVESINSNSVAAPFYTAFHNSNPENNNTVQILVHNVSGTLILGGWGSGGRRIVNQGITLTYDTPEGKVTIDGNSDDDPNNVGDFSTIHITTVSCQQAYNLTHVPTTATCTEGGKSEYDICSVCNRVYLNGAETTLDQLPTVGALGHDLTPVDEVPPTCTENGNSEHYSCTRCSKLFLDNAGVNETTPGAVTLPAAHSLTPVDEVPSTCTVNGYRAHYACSNCTKLFEDAAGQTETNLTKLSLLLAAHSLTHVGMQPATCTEDGILEHWVCTREGCGALFSDGQGTSPMTNVTETKRGHLLTHVDAKNPTYAQDGNIEYWMCTREGCGTLFADKEETKELTPEEIILPMLVRFDDLPKTGDSSRLTGWLALLGACCAGLLCLNRRRG